MKTFALEIMKAAAAAGYTLAVKCDGETDYSGASASAAWAAVKAVEVATVVLTHPERPREVMVVGAHGLEPDETVIDHTADGFVEQEWRRVFNEASAA